MVNVFCTKLFSKKSLETINSEMISMEIVQNIRSIRIIRKGGNLNVFRVVITMVQPNMDNDSEEDNPDWDKFWSYDPSPEDPHEFGELTG